MGNQLAFFNLPEPFLQAGQELGFLRDLLEFRASAMYERLRRQGRAGDREHDHERKFFFWRLRGLFEIVQPEGLVDELRKQHCAAAKAQRSGAAALGGFMRAVASDFRGGGARVCVSSG